MAAEPMLDIRHPRLRGLYEYWQQKRGDREMPARADLDPLEMAFVIGNVILIDVLEGLPPRFRIRLHGTNLSQRIGVEMTGKMVDDLPDPDFRERALRTFAEVSATRQIFHGRRERVLDGQRAAYETVVMPLSSDGKVVDMLLVGLIHDDERR